ncbi:hypothetical protein FSARC_6071 [Fusarium sarcochroum]|uniref:Pentatricopeptide repeat-containing protein-mitochondrial domain-containing protein n=1 Tax=Fusarium sarcochroum TaxID=1208366 RepID=A0A8H4TY53_9HYPO|nr:hypothetical protein FSARC_6071 [Fusarium sarcochroum]
MADPMGSSLGVRRLLEDMFVHKIGYTAELCYSALEALTVHPDYVARQDIIDIMNRYWFEFTVPARQNIALGMLRDGQYEMAFEKITELMESKDRVDLWVYDIFIVEFGRMGFLDEMLQILKKRKHAQGTHTAFRSIMLTALDVFSQAFHLKGTVFAWADVIQTSVHNPSTGILENVLATGAKHGDTSLATKALDMLSKRTNGRLLHQHHEAVLEAFVNAGNMTSAFSTLKMVQNSGWIVIKGHTRLIYRHLLKSPDLIDTAVSTIANMHKEGPLPLQLVMVTVEALAQVQNAEAAMPLYRDIYFLTGHHPGYVLIKHLLERSAGVETKYALAKDFDALVVKGTEKPGEALSAYEIMIPACAEKGDFDLAFSLAERVISLLGKMESRKKLNNGSSPYKPWRTHEWVEPLVDHALKAKDSRVWRFVDELDLGNDAPAKMIRQLLQRHPIERPAKQAVTTVSQVMAKHARIRFNEPPRQRARGRRS